MCSTSCSTIYMGTEIIKKLEFKNSEIFKHQSDFTGDKGIEWNGVRNFQAVNNLKNMKLDDKCFFYHR